MIRTSLPRLAVVVVAVLGMVAVAAAQRPTANRVAVLYVGRPDYPALKGLQDGLREMGYQEGRNLELEVAIKATYDELRPIAQGYRERKKDVVVTIGDTTTALARDATPGTPIVFVHSVDPVRFVGSLARPHANVTGVASYTDSDMQAKRLEVFKEVVPGLRRVIALYNARADASHHARNLAVVRKATSRLGLSLLEVPVASGEEAETALSGVALQRTDGIFLICSGLFRQPYPKIAARAMQERVPVNACDATQLAEQGGLVLHAPDSYRLGRRGAWYVDQLLKGRKPEELPVETPTTLDLSVSLKTARAIGLTIPPEVLLRANQVIR